MPPNQEWYPTECVWLEQNCDGKGNSCKIFFFILESEKGEGQKQDDVQVDLSHAHRSQDGEEADCEGQNHRFFEFVGRFAAENVCVEKSDDRCANRPDEGGDGGAEAGEWDVDEGGEGRVLVGVSVAGDAEFGCDGVELSAGEGVDVFAVEEAIGREIVHIIIHRLVERDDVICPACVEDDSHCDKCEERAV